MNGPDQSGPAGDQTITPPLPGFSATNDILRIADVAPIAGGVHRDVYPVPGQPQMLVKVLNESRRNPSERPFKRVIRALLPHTKYRILLIEAVHEMKIAARAGPAAHDVPLAKCFGIAATDLGAGLLVERIADASGGLAPRLLEIHRRGELDSEVLALLNGFVGRVFALRIVAGDLNEGNIVLGLRGGERRFFLVDGFGDRHAIPIRTWSQRLNSRALDLRFRRMAERMGLSWDAQRRAFDFAADGP